MSTNFEICDARPLSLELSQVKPNSNILLINYDEYVLFYEISPHSDS